MSFSRLKAKELGRDLACPPGGYGARWHAAGDPLRPGPGQIAHRGLHGSRFPENSLGAFQAALAAGAGIECDLRLSRDDEVMVFHDGDLSRLCGVAGQIETMRAADLARLRLLGGDEHIPTLRELLAITGDRVPLMLELKTRNGNFARLAARTARALANYSGRVGVLSGDPLVGAYLALARPWVRRGFPVSGRNSAAVRAIKLMIARPQFLVVKAEFVDRPWVQRMRATIPVYAWTIRDRATWERATSHSDGLIWEICDDAAERLPTRRRSD